MPKKKDDTPARDEIEADFLEALKRLQSGKPRSKKLKEQASRGTLKINFSTVALDAGRSRTLIALENNCRYPRVRQLVLQAKSAPEISAIPRTHTELIQRLRMDKAELASQVRKFQAEAVVQALSRTKAEKALAAAESLASQLRKQIVALGKVATITPRK